ncbi:MAG: hypothetical protein JSV88_27025 [Candidatus Aminicenantes bacterium]|nr:MAG: hypothetical protein JSV88_27025 [Candidatus Aminicenantes bacterium]
MQKKIFFVMVFFLTVAVLHALQDDYLTIDASVEPRYIKQGVEGILKMKITPKNGLKISSHPDFMIKLDKNNDLSFSKVFFTASELDFQTKQENDTIFLELEKEVVINFKVNEDALIGKQEIRGEVIFTAVFQDNWSLKTYQKFYVDFHSRKNSNLKLKRK